MTVLSKLLVSATFVDGKFLGTSKFGVQMNPAHVADLLKETQAEWVDLAMTEATKDAAESKMMSSCEEIIDAMVKSSEGEKGRLSSYFGEVCSTYDRTSGKGEDKQRCSVFSESVISHLSEDVEWNREEFKAKSVCDDYWQRDVSAYAQQAASERAEKARQEEEAKVAAEQKKQAEEDAKKAGEKKKADDARKAAEQKAKDDAQTRAEKMKKAEEQAKVAEKEGSQHQKETLEATKKAAASIKKADATIADVKKTMPEKVFEKKAAETMMGRIEAKVQKFTRKAVSYVKSAVHGTSTMADAMIKENHMEPENHSIYQTVMSHESKKVEIHETSKQTAKAAVADKVAAIKERIARKFAPEEKKSAEDRLEAIHSKLKSQITSFKASETVSK